MFYAQADIYDIDNIFYSHAKLGVDIFIRGPDIPWKQ